MPEERVDVRRERLSALCGFISCQRQKGTTNRAKASSTVLRLTSHRFHQPSHVYPLTAVRRPLKPPISYGVPMKREHIFAHYEQDATRLLEAEGGRVRHSHERVSGRGSHLSHLELQIVLRRVRVPRRRAAAARQGDYQPARPASSDPGIRVSRRIRLGRHGDVPRPRTTGRAGSILPVFPPPRESAKSCSWFVLAFPQPPCF